MKKYNAPEMKTLAFLPEENMAAAASKAGGEGSGSNLYNDAEFGGW